MRTGCEIVRDSHCNHISNNLVAAWLTSLIQRGDGWLRLQLEVLPMDFDCIFQVAVAHGQVYGVGDMELSKSQVSAL